MNSDAMRLARLACRVRAIVQTDPLRDVSELLPRLDWLTGVKPKWSAAVLSADGTLEMRFTNGSSKTITPPDRQ